MRLTLKPCSQLAVFAIQAVDLHSKEAVWLNEDGVHPVRLFLAPSCSLLSEGGRKRNTCGTIAQSPVGRRSTAHLYQGTL